MNSAVLWNSPNGGSIGNGHGRFASVSDGQWQKDDFAVIIHAPNE